MQHERQVASDREPTFSQGDRHVCDAVASLHLPRKQARLPAVLEIELMQPHVEAIDSDDVATCNNAIDRIDASDHVDNMSAWQPRSTSGSPLARPSS